MRTTTAWLVTGALLTPIGLASLLPTPIAPAANASGPSVGPDVTVAFLPGIEKFGSVGGITGYAIATTSCNRGDENLPWFDSTNPVIAQNLYRLENGRFEQLGMSWVKHGFGALAGNQCGVCQNPGTFDFLGPGCSDPYSTIGNGNQAGFDGIAGLGPRSEINASTGFFPFPYAAQGQSGDAIYKRLQVRNDDLDPALHPDAQFFIEGHYVTPHDAAAGNQNNNMAFRPVLVGAFTDGGYELSVTGTTTEAQPAIEAWAAADGGVEMDLVDVPNDGRLIVGASCTDNGDGTWHYEYAVYNMNSHRSGQAFVIPLPPRTTVTNTGFHHVTHHSGEPFDDSNWTLALTADAISWSTRTFAQNENANALRWGTLFNFRFDADVAPGAVDATLAIFRPGSPATMTVATCGPAAAPACVEDLDGTGDVGFGDILRIIAAWGPCGAPCPEDLSDNGNVDFADILAVIGAWGPCA